MASATAPTPRPSSRLRECLGPALTVGAMLAIWLYLGYRESRRLLPPHGTDTLVKLAAAVRPTSKLAIVDDGGKRYFVWIGKLNVVTVSSGPPVYVFDASGKLIDHCDDDGETGNVRAQRFSRLGWEGPEISFEDAIKRTKP
jgi:hypothetical protein